MAGWLVALLVLVALAPESLKVAVAMLFGAPSFAFILRNYLNWPPKEPFKPARYLSAGESARSTPSIRKPLLSEQIGSCGVAGMPGGGPVVFR